MVVRELPTIAAQLSNVTIPLADCGLVITNILGTAGVDNSAPYRHQPVLAAAKPIDEHLRDAVRIMNQWGC